ncbi:hypothetical protein [Vulcanisaeta thermophila]|uniref:hypothetical protein n=1 Tax=Vulcanisaeta thermophila TaxID=867917 RepID=UPI0008530469|nr:hypothetical protein [Vulcanisaeta thermophila]
MALDRLIAEVILLVGVVYLSISLFLLINHFVTLMNYAHYINEMSNAYIEVPDAVITSGNRGSNNVYLVIYNVGNEPVVLRGIYGDCGGYPLVLNQNVSGTIMEPNQYVVITGTTGGNSCGLSIVYCIVGSELCALKSVNTTEFTLGG